MDYDKLTLEEIKKGYCFDPEEKAYVCNYCEHIFQLGHVYPISGSFFEPEQAAAKHIEEDHRGQLRQLLRNDTRYSTLTDKQKELLTLIHLGMSDDEIAKELGISVSKIRRQKFTFREKAKQAKLYLAIFECVFEDEGVNEKTDDLIYK